MLAAPSARPGSLSSLPLGAPAPTNTASKPPLSSNSRIDLIGWLSLRSTPISTICAISSLSTSAGRRNDGNVGAHQAAGHAVLLEDGDRVAERHQVVGHGQRGAARADQRHLLAVLELGDLRQTRPDVFVPVVGGDALQAADGHRLFFDAAAAAGRLTGPVADPPEDAREHVRMPVHHVGVGEAALSNKSNVFGDVGVCWASPLAIHDFVKVVGLRSVRRLHIPPDKNASFPPPARWPSIGFTPINE